MAHKKIGLLGGTSPESTVGYYHYLTGEYRRRFGDHGFPEILIYSVCFQEMLDWGRAGRWDRVTDKAVEVFDRLQTAGADFGLLTANTLHIVFDEIAARVSLPLVSIVETTVEAVAERGLDCVGLLGTADTMDASFYPRALERRGIGSVVPVPEQRPSLSRIIYEELTRGQIRDESKREYLRAIADLRQRGARGVLLACTEIPLLVGPGDVDLPLFDTMEIHAERALRMATERPGS